MSNHPAPATAKTTAQTSPDQALSDFAAWMLSQSEDRLAMIGVKGSVEEPMRLLRAYARENGVTLS